MTPDPNALSRRRPAVEQGSAYVVTLLALVVLTILALSLTLLTQSEMQIGTNERIVQRIFYAADAGVAVSPVLCYRRRSLSGDLHRLP